MWQAREHAAFVESRCQKLQAERDEADAERQRAQDLVPPAVAGQRAAEERCAVLAAEKRGVEESTTEPHTRRPQIPVRIPCTMHH